MRRILNKFFNWVLNYGEAVRSESSPIYRSQTASFIVVKADNGWLVESYDVSQDKTRRRIVEEGQSIGQAVDVILVESRLAK